MTLAEGGELRVRFVQFHPTLQYEDFVEGHVPKASGQFELVPKHFRFCERGCRPKCFLLNGYGDYPIGTERHKQ